nr:flocculation protein FLO11-like [Lolium perenne]
MAGMINGGGGTEGGTQGKHDATQGGTHDGPISIDEVHFFEEDQPQVTKGASHRTGNFTELEDVCLCEAWSDQSEDSLTKRWAWIQEKITKFNATYDKTKKRKIAKEKKSFNLVLCWMALKDFPKWHDLYASYDVNSSGESPATASCSRLGVTSPGAVRARADPAQKAPPPAPASAPAPASGSPPQDPLAEPAPTDAQKALCPKPAPPAEDPRKKEGARHTATSLPPTAALGRTRSRPRAETGDATHTAVPLTSQNACDLRHYEATAGRPVPMASSDGVARSDPARAAGASAPPSPAQPTVGSRFFCLAEDEDSDEETRETAEEAAWSVLGLDPIVQQIGRSLELSKEEVRDDFWTKIGYPTSESRVWSRSASPEVRFSSCRSSERARSASPPPGEKVKRSAMRAASSSPVGLRLSRMPRMKPWRGPLPRRRVTPAPIFGDFLAAVSARRPAAIAPLDPSSGSATSVVLGASPTPSRVVVEATLAASSSVPAEVPAVRPLIAAGLEPRFKPADAALEASSSGPQGRWAWFGRAVMAVQKAPRCVPHDNSIRSRAIDQFSYRSRDIFAAAARPQAATVEPSSSPASTPSQSAGLRRSFAQVVVGVSSSVEMAGAARPPASPGVIAAGLEPRFKPADAALEASSGGPQGRWAWFGRAVMAVQKAPRCVPHNNSIRSRAVGRRSVVVLEEVLPTSEHASLPHHLDAGQRTFRVNGPVKPVIPPPWAEGQADGTKGASSSTPFFPRDGGLAWGCCDTGGYITFYPCIDDLFSFTG